MEEFLANVQSAYNSIDGDYWLGAGSKLLTAWFTLVFSFKSFRFLGSNARYLLAPLSLLKGKQREDAIGNLLKALNSATGEWVSLRHYKSGTLDVYVSRDWTVSKAMFGYYYPSEDQISAVNLHDHDITKHLTVKDKTKIRDVIYQKLIAQRESEKAHGLSWIASTLNTSKEEVPLVARNTHALAVDKKAPYKSNAKAS